MAPTAPWLFLPRLHSVWMNKAENTHTQTHVCTHTHRKLGTESVLNVPTSFFMLQYLCCKQAPHISKAEKSSREGQKQGVAPVRNNYFKYTNIFPSD